METTNARLIGAAVRLFQSKGYAAVGVAEILAAAQAPKGSLYHHYPTGKQGLATAAVGVIAGEVDRALARHKAAGTGPAATLAALAAEIADWLQRTDYTQGGLFGAIAASIGPEEEALRQALAGAQGRWIRWFAAALGGGTTAEARAMAGLAALEGAILLARTRRDAAIVTTVAGQIGASWATAQVDA